MNLATFYHTFDMGTRLNPNGLEAVLRSAAGMQMLVDRIKSNTTAFEKVSRVAERTLSDHAALLGTLNAYAPIPDLAQNTTCDEPTLIVENSEYIATCPADMDKLNRRWQGVWGKSGPDFRSRYR